MRAHSPLIWALFLVAPLFGLTRAATAEPGPSPVASGSASGSASASVSASASSAVSASPSGSASTKSLRRARPEPTEIETIDLSPDGDDQAFALGAQAGWGALGVSGGGPIQGTFDLAIVGDIGLGPAGKRVPWTLEPWLAFAMPYNAFAGTKGYPNRFTEVGVRIVHRWGEDSFLAHRWVALGVGAVWTNTRPTSGFFDLKRRCYGEPSVAEAAGLDCSSAGAIAPGALLDLAVGLHETTIRRARWGFGARIPIQISSHPGVGLLGFFYAQVGTAR